MYLYDSPVYRQDLETALAAVPDSDKLHRCAVMITGASGLIGSFVADMLLTLNRTANAGIDVYAVGRDRARLAQRFEGINDPRLHLVEHDVTAPPDFSFPVDYVIHAASNAYPAAFSADPVGTVLSNIMGTNYLLSYARAHGARRFLFVSSGEVYGQGDPALTAFPESYSGYVDPTRPRSCYPAAKRAAETLCASYTAQYGLPTVIVRPCHTYGPNVTAADNRANVQFVNDAVAGRDIVMKSRGAQMRSYCYVADCASALLTVLLRGVPGEAYNIAHPTARVTIAEFAKTAARLTGQKVVFSEMSDAEKAGDTAISYAVLDSQKLCALGWTGNYSVERGLKHTIQTVTILKK